MVSRIVAYLKNLKHLIEALLATILYCYPAKKLKVVGVTGTDGKTTTVHLIHHILNSDNKKVAFVSTLGAKMAGGKIETGLHVTTPNPWLLQKILRQFVDKKIEYVVLETTSHGLDQHRLLGCNFSIGVLTNITHEHLDYHRTFNNYLRTKAKLFRRVEIAILNRDDKHFNYLKQVAKRAKIVIYGIEKKADYTPENFKFKTKLPGEYNLYNCLAAIATACSLGIDKKVIKKALLSFKPVKGRMEEIKEGQNFRVIIDFAHTPNGLEKALTTLKKQKDKARLIVVFGCAGERDVQKRPMMGEIASRLADLVILTAEDPRTEDINKIIEQIARGCQKMGGIEEKTFFRVPDRQEAINFAIQKLAKKDDIVVICGKGHEKSMCFGKTEVPWSDQKAAKKGIKTRLKKEVVN